MNRILVTGGAGFIGSHVVARFQGAAEVTVLDDFRSGHHRNLDGLACRLVTGSILDEGKLAKAIEGADAVFHLAAMISVPESVSSPRLCEELNTLGTERVLQAAVKAGARKVVLASSAAIYGDSPVVPKVETMTPDPRSPYASTKLAGEQLLEHYRRAHGLSTTSLRFFNVFGPRQDPASAYAAAIPSFITRALRHDPITIHGDGGQTRDFVYVEDVVGALAFVAARPDLHGVFNVGYGESVSILRLAEEIIRLAGSRSAISHSDPRPGDVRHSLAGADKLRAAGWKPAFTVSEGLARTIDFYRRVRA